MAKDGRITFLAPAKINLYLKVRGRRPDGYHELDSVLARLELSDRINLTLTPGRLEDGLVSATTLPTALPPDFNDPGNLALKAVRAFRERAGWPEAGVDLFIEKNIPLGAGLGGGSSNGAAVLTALNQMAPSPLRSEALAELGLSLGADVPFFLQPRPLAQAAGVGEKLTAAPKSFRDWAGKALTLVNPGFHLSTALVFQNLGLTNRPPHNNLGRMSHEPSPPLPGENDLLPPARKLAPALAQTASVIEGLKPEFWGLSGSGPTFWFCAPEGLGPSDRDGFDPGWWVCETKIRNFTGASSSG